MPQFTPIQSQVMAGLLAGKSVSAVARENGIHRSTIYHWRNEHPYFNIVLDQARSRHQVNMYDLVQDLTEQALETVATMLEADDATLRLRAAQTILRVADPARLPKGLRSSMEIETMADQTLAQRAELDLAPMREAIESDTIRQNSTVKSEPSRNSRCACGSGLKYKRCCAGSQIARPADREVSFSAASPA